LRKRGGRPGAAWPQPRPKHLVRNHNHSPPLCTPCDSSCWMCNACEIGVGHTPPPPGPKREIKTTTWRKNYREGGEKKISFCSGDRDNEKGRRGPGEEARGQFFDGGKREGQQSFEQREGGYLMSQQTEKVWVKVKVRCAQITTKMVRGEGLCRPRKKGKEKGKRSERGAKHRPGEGVTK